MSEGASTRQLPHILCLANGEVPALLLSGFAVWFRHRDFCARLRVRAAARVRVYGSPVGARGDKNTTANASD